MADHKIDKDSVTGVETTGHEWDGIKELNNPAPRWWLIVWLVCCVWAVGYWVVYPTWPTIAGHTEGLWKWTEYDKLREEQAEIKSRQAPYLARFEAASFGEIMTTPDLYEFARAGGQSAFKDNCAVCHGSGAMGGPGFPNLNDDDWLWGGTVEDIHTTLRYGIRSTHPDTRTSMMPNWGKDGLLEAAQINQVVDYVLSLSGKATADAAGAGATVFAENCAACHGDTAKGMREFGAPNLSDAIWLYGGEREAVYNSVYTAHAGVMPTWEGRLDANTLRELAVYVHSLGGGEASVEATPAAVTAPAVESPVDTPAAQ